MSISPIPFIILSFFICFSFSLQAQDKVVDSLKNELSIHTEKDEKRVDLLNNYSYNYRRHNLTIAEEKSIEAYDLATELGYEKGLAKSFLLFSKIHISKAEFNEALEDALESLKLYKNLNSDDPKVFIPVYNSLGMISSYQNDPDASLDYFRKSLNIAEESGDLKSQGDAFGNIGVTYYKKGEFDDAINYYKQGIAVYEASGNTERSLTILNNIGGISIMQGRYAEALEYLNRILIIYREENKKDKIAMTLENIGIVYSKVEKYKKALGYFEESLRLHKELELNLGIAINLNSIGSTYVDLKEYNKGLEYLTEALSLNKEINNIASLVANHNAIGNVYIILQEPNLALSSFKSSLALSVTAEDKSNIGGSHSNLAETYLILKDYPKALYHAKEGKKIVDTLEMLLEQQSVNNTLSEIYEVNGDFKKALKYFKVHKTLNDSLFNKENIEEITQLEYEYKYKQQIDSANIRELKLTKTVTATNIDLEKSKRIYLWAIIIFLFVSVLLGSIIFYLKVRNIKSETQNIVIEQKLLRSQMTPHFIFNSLSVLQGMILNKEDKKSVTYLSKFSKLLRIILENSRDKMVLLSQELAAVENYLALQNLENNAYTYHVSVDKAIDIPRFEIPAMLIQPFVENAIEHAFENHKENRIIDVQLKYISKQLICTIIDNGIGINAKVEGKRKDKNSLATAITSERLAVLSKDFKMKGSITIEDREKYSEQGTVVTLVIPYILDVA